ncbi:flagellar hook-associated protein FlgK [Gemmobacter fulvus]|uniref:Flagellar hook-associated protein 1 n=1 Tax=Gemmobacter fulvus TaxID=2840474 RepID=A0A975P3L2_9RHOB|nr:flagellar hook-associated protein FlgK [Gemmobacter fulvus]MBT9246870.1 flagellar hook-associated protein FlgK [Gemmobacter fulvus]MDQ1850688.1 flagellar hook-associated protein FlgK [Gemmobacter fulvus]QWK89039.1 flagellar hook-associated protein FlgK [Gemmobacter fulvus]
MSISYALNTALSGLTVSARAAALVSSNVANAMTPGYARRELELSARDHGGQGVRVSAILRHVDLHLLTERRQAEAGLGNRHARASLLGSIETAIGTVDSAESLGGHIAAFDSALLEAASRPESESRLKAVFVAAGRLTDHATQAAEAIQRSRSDADARIAGQVSQLNNALARVEDLNTRIRATTAAGQDGSALMDLRQQQIDAIARIIPIQEVDRGGGVVALFAQSGAALLDGKAARFGFEQTRAITPDMTQASGALSGLTLNGRAVTTTESGLIGGGSLAADFAIRDELAPAAQARLDAVVRDLIERFEDSGLDASRAPGAPGLFTDAGAAFAGGSEVGLSQRLRLNAAVDPAQGGALWRLRDGLGAAVPGVAGNSALLTALQEALVAERVPSSGAVDGGARSFAGLASDMVSAMARDRLSADQDLAYASARASGLQQQELENGVDTDQEMQKLLLIEQTFSANARVMQAVDDMLSTLMEL